MSWKLHDFTGNSNSRISNPELWDDMCERRYIADTLKEELIRKETSLKTALPTAIWKRL